MTLWEFACATAGYRAANGAEEKAEQTMSIDRMRELGIVGIEDE